MMESQKCAVLTHSVQHPGPNSDGKSNHNSHMNLNNSLQLIIIQGSNTKDSGII